MSDEDDKLLVIKGTRKKVSKGFVRGLAYGAGGTALILTFGLVPTAIGVGVFGLWRLSKK